MAMKALPVFRLQWILLALALTACGPTSRVVLLPDADGKVGRVEVTSDGKSATLTEAYQAADARAGSVSETRLTAAEVDARYGSVRAALSAPPLIFVLYFEAGGRDLTEDSRKRLPDIRTAVAARPGYDILVTGHTDRVGAVEANDELSLTRATAVREMLISEGFDGARISVAGRGEREPAVATEDEVDEPRNRRVEVKVR